MHYEKTLTTRGAFKVPRKQSRKANLEDRSANKTRLSPNGQ